MDGIFDRRLRGLLNKITKESFTTISTQVVTPINGAESNAQTLLRVVRLVYEHGIGRRRLLGHLCSSVPNDHGGDQSEHR